MTGLKKKKKEVLNITDGSGREGTEKKPNGRPEDWSSKVILTRILQCSVDLEHSISPGKKHEKNELKSHRKQYQTVLLQRR